MLRVEWDREKNRQNIRKHGISFEEAATVLRDPYARFIADPDHSDPEDRFILLGLSMHLRMLVVCHCYREEEKVLRIFSARKATRKEAELYEERLP